MSATMVIAPPASSESLAALAPLGNLLHQDLPIEDLERLESDFKALLASTIESLSTAEEAMQLAELITDVGLLFKYKSYAIKASSPLGYSVFVQNPGEGFSFQRHRSHKTEIFHILETRPGASVFLAEYSDWEKCYEPAAFAAWLEGAHDPRYERFRFRPEPGDVIVIDEVGVVHSLLGCVLEEFASVSTDMVDRLFDQNLGRGTPAHFNRQFAQQSLQAISAPDPKRLIRLRPSGFVIEPILAHRSVGGETLELGETPAFVARRHKLFSGATLRLEADPARAVVLYLLSGDGRLTIAGEPRAQAQSSTSLSLRRGCSSMVPPGFGANLECVGKGPLVVSEHRIAPAWRLCRAAQQNAGAATSPPPTVGGSHQ